MSHLKLTSACALILMLAATSAAAGQKTRTKSNNSNDRSAPEGVVLQDVATGANACFTGMGPWSWAISSVGSLTGSGAAAASYARTAEAQSDIGAVCDSVQAAIDRINADAALSASMAAAIDAQNEAEMQRLLMTNGLSAASVPGAQFHAINTKGTAATNHRGAPASHDTATETQASDTAAGRNIEAAQQTGINVIVERVGGQLILTLSRNKTGHVTLNR